MKTERGGFRMLQHEQLLQEMVHDPYQETKKHAEPATCPTCGAVYHRGRWTWGKALAEAHAVICPACRRIREGAPAGFVKLAGEFLHAHQDEILARVRHCEKSEKEDHPLQRIMAIQAEQDGLLVTTTDPHLARRIGEAVNDAFHGELAYHYNKEENLLRVSWRR